MKAIWLFVLAVFTVFAVDQKGADQNGPPAPAAIGSETAEIIRQTVAKVVAYGEFARICTSMLSNDQSQLRDVQQRNRDAHDHISDLQRDARKLQATTVLGQALNIEIANLTHQIAQTNDLIAKLSKQESDLSADIAAQQKCVSTAETQLNSIINNPAQTLGEPRKK
jgi:predicted  nucleic acid-binding Zn-ribbon protein